ncbi:hypothetical protein [Streptomyces sp. NPDC050485]|uniref:hypothetical protein n=1 Tax=Streptomyces sp. NPDC050485 TaxID=3365617 RepID=UPI0037B2ED0F
MSVNYYAFGPFDGGERGGEGLHIGQSAQGSKFLMRAHSDLGLTSLNAWTKCLRQTDVTIANENGISLTVGDLRDIILRRRDSYDRPARDRFVHGYERPGYHVDPQGGIEFCALEFC